MAGGNPHSEPAIEHEGFPATQSLAEIPSIDPGTLQTDGLVPREETYGLSAQIRRAASSTSANLAEGCGRNGDAELARYRGIASGSASELEYHLLLARDLKLI